MIYRTKTTYIIDMDPVIRDYFAMQSLDEVVAGFKELFISHPKLNVEQRGDDAFLISDGTTRMYIHYGTQKKAIKVIETPPSSPPISSFSAPSSPSPPSQARRLDLEGMARRNRTVPSRGGTLVKRLRRRKERREYGGTRKQAYIKQGFTVSL